MIPCEVCGIERVDDKMLFRDGRYFCDSECYQSYYTVRGVNILGNGATRFTELLDVPQTYSGNNDKILKVNTAGSGLEFSNPTAGTETDPIFTAWDKSYESLTNKPDLSSLHLPHSDDQDLSGLVVKETGKSLVLDTEIVKIHSNTLDHDGSVQDSAIAGKTTLTEVKADTDIASAISLKHANTLDHSHTNKTTLDNIQEALTTTLKTNYDNSYTHSQSAHAPSNAQANADITKAEIEAKLTGVISTHSHAGGGGDLWTKIKLASDFVTSNSSDTAVTNFNFTPSASKTYLISGYFLLRTATATIGARPGVSFPSGLTDKAMRAEASNSLTTSAIRMWGAVATGNAASTGLADTTNSHWGSLDGIIITGVSPSGNLQVTLAAETAGTNVTMKAGSILMYREL